MDIDEWIDINGDSWRSMGIKTMMSGMGLVDTGI